MRTVDEIVWHCSATPEGRHVTVDEIRNWHTYPKDHYNKQGKFLYVTYYGKKYSSREELPKEVQNKHGRGWSDIGYHYIVYLDGAVVEGRPIERSGAHVAGKNRYSVGCCYVGGTEKFDIETPKDTRTLKQKEAIIALNKRLIKRFSTISKLSGHNKYAKKACPAFDWKQEFNSEDYFSKTI